MKKTFVLFVLLCTLRTTQAQDYHHYLISWNDEGTQYIGVLAANTRVPTQILRLLYYSEQLEEYRLIEEKFKLSIDGNYFLLESTRLSDRTACYEGYATNYNADNFYMVENGLDIELWNIDDAAVIVRVNEEFIPLKDIDYYKPFFWPEAYGICNTEYWHGLIQLLFK